MCLGLQKKNPQYCLITKDRLPKNKDHTKHTQGERERSLRQASRTSKPKRMWAFTTATSLPPTATAAHTPTPTATAAAAPTPMASATLTATRTVVATHSPTAATTAAQCTENSREA